MKINRYLNCRIDLFADVGKKVVTTYDKVVAKWNELTKGKDDE